MRGGDASPQRAGEPNKSSLPAAPHPRKTVKLLIEDTVDSIIKDDEINNGLVDRILNDHSSSIRALFGEALDVVSVTKVLKLFLSMGSALKQKHNYRKLESFLVENDSVEINEEILSKSNINFDELFEFLLLQIDRFEDYIKPRLQKRLTQIYLSNEIDWDTFMSMSYSISMIHPMALKNNVKIQENGEFNGPSGFFENVGFASTFGPMYGGNLCLISAYGRIFVEKCLNPVIKELNAS